MKNGNTRITRLSSMNSLLLLLIVVLVLGSNSCAASSPLDGMARQHSRNHAFKLKNSNQYSEYDTATDPIRGRRRPRRLSSMLPKRMGRRKRMLAEASQNQLPTATRPEAAEAVRGGSDLPSSSSDNEESSSSSDSTLDEDDLSSTTSDTNVNLKSLKLKRRRFLDHIALISTSFLKKEHPAHLLDNNNNNNTTTTTHDDDAITPQTDLTLPGRHFHVVTTAALPWMTGTAVNPLLRAAYLHRRTQQLNNNHNSVNVDLSVVLEQPHHASSGEIAYSTASSSSNSDSTLNSNNSQQPKEPAPHNHQWVTLVIPWLELEEDQLELYGQVFDDEPAQEAYIRRWLAEHAGMPDVADPETGLKLLFYPARYHSGLRSIFAMGDICQLIIPDHEEEASKNENNNESNSTTTKVVATTSTADVCILEEPEHCNWYRAPGDGWTQKFQYVVGIVHTNYKEYATAHYSGLWTAPAIALMSSAMVRAYCHQVIKLSDVLQTFAPEKETTSNVHGVRSDFLEVGVARSQVAVGKVGEVSNHEVENNNNSNTTVYFIGKLLWAKGLDLLLELEDYYKQCTGDYFPIDIYGSGPEQKAIRRAYWGRKLGLNGTAVHHGDNETATEDDATSEQAETHKHHHRHHHRHSKTRGHHRHKQKTKIFTSKTAFKEHLQKIKESLPSADDFRLPSAEDFRQFKESMSSVELPSTFHEWRRQPIPATFPGRVDHASLGKHANYNVFVNPSISEVLCTTTAEALAMGKFAIIPVHPSNAFFLKFPNCLAYRNKFEFAANLQWALTHDPEPLTPELAHEFTWEAATDRFLSASAVTWKEARERERLGLTKRDERIAWFLNEMGKGPKGDFIRSVLGAGPASGQVKYVLEQQSQIMDEDEEEDESAEDMEGGEDDDEDEGLTKKFHQSSLVQALRASLPSTILGTQEG